MKYYPKFGKYSISLNELIKEIVCVINFPGDWMSFLKFFRPMTRSKKGKLSQDKLITLFNTHEKQN